MQAHRIEQILARTGYFDMNLNGKRDCVADYIFLASEDSGYMTGQVFHPNGGTIVGS